MCKVARIIHFTDQMGSGSQPAGRIDFIIAVMSDLKFCIVNILRFFRCVQINENFIQMQSTDFLVSVPAGIIGGIDNSACLQFFYMSRQSTVRNVQFCCQFVHVHFFVFNQQFYNFNPNIGAKCFKNVQSIIQ